MRIVYFLEDRTQEGFIKAMVERIAKEESVSLHSLIHDIRSARGGSRIIIEFKNFLKDSIKMDLSDIDLLIVAIDGNCKGHADRVKELHKYIKANHPFRDRVVYAIPDPHIERWYIMDQRAFKDGVGLEKGADMPEYKCKKAYYKHVLNQALRDSNVSSLLSGAEYAEKIVDHIENIDSFSRQNAGCQAFVGDLRGFFRRGMRT